MFINHVIEILYIINWPSLIFLFSNMIRSSLKVQFFFLCKLWIKWKSKKSQRRVDKDEPPFQIGCSTKRLCFFLRINASRYARHCQQLAPLCIHLQLSYQNIDRHFRMMNLPRIYWET